MESEYSKSCVYEITWKETIYYVGSSKNFENRIKQHKSDYKNENSEKYNKPLYNFLRDNGDWTNEWTMTIIQSYPDCKSRRELLEYEREHYEILKPVFNKCRPIVHDGEQSEIRKQYRLENAEKIKEKNKLYYEENAEKIKESIKQYKLENAEKIKESDELYREENAEKINKQCVCACGADYTHKHESRHKKSKKHQKFVEEQKNNVLAT